MPTPTTLKFRRFKQQSTNKTLSFVEKFYNRDKTTNIMKPYSFFTTLLLSWFATLQSNVADPGCLSWILIFIHPGCRISDHGFNNSYKRGGGKLFLSYHFCSYKYHKIVNNFIFEQVKKIVLPKKLRIIVIFTQKIVIGIGIRDLGSGENPFRILGQKKAPDPGSRIRICNTVSKHHQILLPSPYTAEISATWQGRTSTSFLSPDSQGL